MNFNKAIVTGGAGFIENISITSPSIFQIFKNFSPDITFHLAAIPGVAYSVENPHDSDFVNISGTVNILEASKNVNVKRFVFSSSSSVYGGSEVLPTPENTPLNPKSPYALQKKVGEEYCKLFSNTYNLETVCLRYFNVFGPRQYGDSPYASVISSFAESLKNNTQPIIHGDGSQFRDFCPVENVVHANILAATIGGRLIGDVFNIGCGDKTSINDLHRLMGCLPAKYIESRPGDVKCSQADISSASNMLGYKIKKSFNDGLKNTINWYLKISK